MFKKSILILIFNLCACSFNNKERIINKYLDKSNKKLKCGLINKEGQEIVPLKYSFISFCYPYDDFLIIRLKDKWGYLDNDNKELVPIIYDEVNCFL